MWFLAAGWNNSHL